MVGLLIPSRYEAVPFLRELDSCRSLGSNNGITTYKGRISNQPVVVGICGVGCDHTVQRVGQWLDRFHLNGLILAGFAGALHPKLKRGQIFIGAGSSPLKAPEMAEALPPHQYAMIHTCDSVVATASDKHQLFEKTGCPLVDMETARVSEAAATRRLGLIVVRAVSDLSDEDVPVVTLSRGFDVISGHYTPFRLAAHLVLHPFQIKKLYDFSAPLPEVRTRLSEFLCALIGLGEQNLFE